MAVRAHDPENRITHFKPTTSVLYLVVSVQTQNNALVSAVSSAEARSASLSGGFPAGLTKNSIRSTVPKKW